MAVIRKDEQAKQLNQGTQQGYTGMQGVSQNTANQLGNYQQGYKPSDTVTAAQKQLQAVQAQKPQAYTSRFGDQLDSILAQIQEPQDQKFDFNGSELFKSYADIYNRYGKNAMMDAMGNAAALTGGYGNSYGQQVGQQTYDEYMNDLFKVGMDIYDRDYQAKQDRRADLYNQYGLLQGQDQQEYGRYRDTVGDWENERGYFTDLYNNERNFDYGAYADALNYWTGMAGQENQDYWTGKNFDESVRQYDTSLAEQQRQYNADLAEKQRQYDASLAEDKRQYDLTREENIRQFDASLDWDKMSADQKYAASWVTDILANGQMPSEELLKAAGLSAEDAQKMMAQILATSGGGSGGKQEKIYRDANGAYYTYDQNGNVKLVDTKNIKNGTLVDYSEADQYKGTTAAKNMMLGNVAAGVDDTKKKTTYQQSKKMAGGR